MHFRLLEAYEIAFQDGVNPTDAVIAKRLNVRRETITRWRRRNPSLRRWLFEQIGSHASELRPLVDRRVTQLAISGSPEHTKLFYQFVAKVGHPLEDGVQEPTNAGVTINILSPRPAMYSEGFNQIAQPAAAALLPAASSTLPPMPVNVPVVNVRPQR